MTGVLVGNFRKTPQQVQQVPQSQCLIGGYRSPPGNVTNTRVNTELNTRGKVLLAIFGESAPPGSPNTDPISDQATSFSIPVLRPRLRI